MIDIAAVLAGGRDALTDDVVAAVVAEGEDAVEALMTIASDADLLLAPAPQGWAPIHAIRLLGRMRAKRAIPALVRVLGGAEGNDQASAHAVRALERIGRDAIPALVEFARQTENVDGRTLALEAISNMAVEIDDAETFDSVAKSLEEMLQQTDDPELRLPLIGYIGDVGRPRSVDALLAQLCRGKVSGLEYEAIRDVVERLGGTCPDMYFDSNGKGYPLNGEKLPLCPLCTAPMSISASGDLMHPPGGCAEARLSQG